MENDAFGPRIHQMVNDRDSWIAHRAHTMRNGWNATQELKCI